MDGSSSRGLTATANRTTASGLIKPYALIETFEITLSKASAVNFSSSTTLTSAVPGPSSFVLAGLGALGIIGFGRLRHESRPIESP